jgi:putative hydrolase of the HAD superfamily
VVEAVLFDWGDTLVEGVVWTDELLLEGNRAGLEAVARDGLPTAEEIAAYLRDHDVELFPPGAEDEVDLAAIVHRCFAELGRPLSDSELESFLEASQRDWLSREQVHPDVHAVLDGLCAQGLRLGIVSNCATPRRFVDRALEEQGLLERMDAVVFSCEVGKVKPHPAIFERALAELEVEPARALFVGDRVLPDVWGPSRLGMSTALALWFYEDEEADAVEPDFRLREPLELLRVVSRA